MIKVYQDRDWLWEQYIVREGSPTVLAKEAKCNSTTIYRWLRKTGIPVRGYSEGGFLARKNSLIITPNLPEFLKGELLGDGGLTMPGRYSASYLHSSKYEELLTWLSAQFAKKGIEQVGRIRRYIDKRTGVPFYCYQSRYYPELVPFYKAWYSERNGKMIKTTVPQGLKLTPIMARQWYLGDGCLSHRDYGRPHINLATCNFDVPSVEYLIGELSELGFKATRMLSDNTINISVYSTKEFLEWIGPCPVSCYNYKWKYVK